MFNANKTYGLYHIRVRNIAKRVIREAHKLNDGSVAPRVYKKIQWYMVETLVTGEMLGALSGKKPERKDIEILVYLGAVMAIIDIVTDDYRIERKVTEDILQQAFSGGDLEEYKEAAPELKICILFLRKLRDAAGAELWKTISESSDLINIQLKSGEQFSDEVTESAVNKLTIKKGGVSVLLCASVLRLEERQLLSALYETGGFIQMMNDCQDMHKDTVAGIKTFIHFCHDFGEILNKLNSQRVKVFRMINELSLPEQAKHRFLFDLNALFIVITYKLHRYSEVCGNKLEFDAIRQIDKVEFRVSPFSFSAFAACTGKIVYFNFEDTPGRKIFETGQTTDFVLK